MEIELMKSEVKYLINLLSIPKMGDRMATKIWSKLSDKLREDGTAK